MLPAAHPAMAIPNITQIMPSSLLRKKPPISHSNAAMMNGSMSTLHFEFSINLSLLFIVFANLMQELVIVLKKTGYVNFYSHSGYGS
jgi:hypothetical protein